MQKFLIIILSVGMLFSCTKEDDMGTGNNGNNNNNGNNGTNNELVNPNPPMDNNIIDFQTTIGPSDDYTSIYEMILAKDDNFFFRGDIEGDVAVGKMNTNGDILWKFRPRYYPRAIFKAENGKLLVIANRDSNSDGAEDEVYIYMFDENGGNPISQISWDNFENIRLNGIGEHIAVGRCQVDDIIYPVIVEFSITDNDILVKEDIIYYAEEASFSFHDVADDFVLASKVIGSFDNVESIETAVGKLTNNFSLDWFRKIEFEDTFGSRPYDMIVQDNKAIFCGKVSVEEDQNPSGGGYWSAGYVASVSANGTVNYTKVINTSNKGDVLQSLFYHDNYIYASGTHSSLFYPDEKEIFKNGWISKVVASTGDVIDNKMLGDEAYASGLNTCVVVNSKYYTAGFTEQFYDGENYHNKGWLIEFDQF